MVALKCTTPGAAPRSTADATRRATAVICGRHKTAVDTASQAAAPARTAAPAARAGKSRAASIPRDEVAASANTRARTYGFAESLPRTSSSAVTRRFGVLGVD